MIRVGLVSTFPPERCGHGCYAEELILSTEDADIEYVQIGRPLDAASIIQRAVDVDIIHINHAHQLFGDLTKAHLNTLRAMGKKTVCTWHESTTENRSELTCAFDRVVVHQPTSDGFTRINDGIYRILLEPYRGEQDFVGVVGFPFAYKGYPAMAAAIKPFGLKLKAFLPKSHHVYVDQTVKEIMQLCPGSEVITDFIGRDEVIKAFSQCIFTMFAYQHTGTGIGGSVRLGIAAQRPVVISNVVRYLDLTLDYSDEFYIVPSGYPTIEQMRRTVSELLDDMVTGKERYPKRVIEDMDWKLSAAAYVKVYKELQGTL